MSTLSRPAGRIEGCGVEPFTPFDTRSARGTLWVQDAHFCDFDVALSSELLFLRNARFCVTLVRANRPCPCRLECLVRLPTWFDAYQNHDGSCSTALGLNNAGHSLG